MGHPRKHKVNWNTVCGAIRDLQWRNIWSADNPVEVLNEHLLLLIERFVPTKIRSLGLMNNAGMLLPSSRRLRFGGPVIAFGLTGKSVTAARSRFISCCFLFVFFHSMGWY